MKEPTIILLLIITFSLLGIGVSYYSIMHSDFNFYKSEIDVNGNLVSEKIYFQPDQSYHTLYRNFFNEISSYNSSGKNTINMRDVKCSEGIAYSREKNSVCTIFSNQKQEINSCPIYTKDNEYGCTFGEQIEFQKGKDYFIQSTYNLNPENLFKINGKDYIKFIAYSSDKHVLLNEGNFQVNKKVIKKNFYLPRDQVILYVPYTGNETGFNVITKNSFEFDNSALEILLAILFVFLPGLSIFLIWFFFGKEKNYPDIPSELPEYPVERAGWEVSAFFNAPFNGSNANFFSTMLISFYHKKIIDIQIRDKEVWIKINKIKEKIDPVESEFLKFLNGLISKSRDKKYFDGSYIYLKQAFQSVDLSSYINTSFSPVTKGIKKEQKKYISTSGALWIITAFFIGAIFLYNSNIFLLGIYLPLILIVTILTGNSALFVRFKEDYYKEYLQWKAFKKYLSHSFTIKYGDHRAVAIWDNYLIYATALGVSKRVLKELRRMNIINEKHFLIYSGIYSSSGSFASAGTFGGGFGGAGGGGVGGGGGGGR